MTDKYRFGGGLAETTLSPVVLAALLVAILLIFVLPRKHLITPFLLISILVPQGQTLVVGGVHLFVVRIIILVGFGRLVTASLTGESSVLGGAFNTIDKAFLCWALSHALAFMLLYGHSDAVVNQFGFLWDSLGGYFFLRFAIHDEEDINRAAKVFAFITILVAVCMLNEQWSKSNVFGFLGGNPRPDIREGKLRSQGPFAHAILAGVFGATIMPLFLRLGSARNNMPLALGGMIGATTMVLTSASSTPLGAYVAGILGVCFWPIRKNMRVIRWGLVLLLVSLALVMKAPVWFLLAHVDLVGGSSGYHRAMLVDTAIRRFGEWWMMGANNNQNWGWDMWDIQNEFVAEALRGGLAALVFFVMIISRSLGLLGTARKVAEVSGSRQEWLIWTLGAVIVAHIVAFFGSDYFDQTRFWWYTSLAMSGVAAVPLLAKNKMDTATDLVSAGGEQVSRFQTTWE